MPRRCSSTCRERWPARSGARTPARCTVMTCTHGRIRRDLAWSDTVSRPETPRAHPAGPDRRRLPQRAQLDQGPVPVPLAALAGPHRDARHARAAGGVLPALHGPPRGRPAAVRARAAAPRSAFSRSGLPRSVQRRPRHLHPADPASAPDEPRSGRRAGHRRQRLADQRVARPGAAPARLDRRRRSRTRSRPSPRSSAWQRQAVRAGPVLGPAARADGPPQVLADLRGCRQARPAHHVARLRLVRQPDHRRRLASFYLEDHVGPAQAVQANIISLVTEGVFERSRRSSSSRSRTASAGFRR